MRSLLRNSRKTERGAGRFLTRLVVRAAPFALMRRTATRRPSTNRGLCLVSDKSPLYGAYMSDDAWKTLVEFYAEALGDRFAQDHVL